MPERPVGADATVLIFLGKLRSLGYLTDSHRGCSFPGRSTRRSPNGARNSARRTPCASRTRSKPETFRSWRPTPHPEIQAYDLVTGETAVLSLALARDHDEVLADEEAVGEARRVADERS